MCISSCSRWRLAACQAPCACQGSGKTFTMSGREDVLALDDYEGGRTLHDIPGLDGLFLAFLEQWAP